MFNVLKIAKEIYSSQVKVKNIVLNIDFYETDKHTVSFVLEPDTDDQLDKIQLLGYEQFYSLVSSELKLDASFELENNKMIMTIQIDDILEFIFK